MQHKDIPNAQLHEVKGASSASVGQLLRFNGDGTSSPWTPDYTKLKSGFWDYNNSTTALSIPLTSAGTSYHLTNDGTGPFTNTSYGLAGVTNIYDPATGYFNFSSLKLGDTVDFRIDADIITSSASVVTGIHMELGIGTEPYSLSLDTRYFKTAATHPVVVNGHIYIGNNTTKNGLARFVASSDTAGAASVKVRGWYIRIITNV